MNQIKFFSFFRQPSQPPNHGGGRTIRSEGCGLVLRIPHDAEAEVVEGAARGKVEALRATAMVGVAVPTAAAQQTIRTRPGPCGVCHAS